MSVLAQGFEWRILSTHSHREIDLALKQQWEPLTAYLKDGKEVVVLRKLVEIDKHEPAKLSLIHGGRK